MNRKNPASVKRRAPGRITSAKVSMDALLYWVGLAAVAVNAITGVLDSSRKQMDLIGALLVGIATALGGGTIRLSLIHI